MEVQIRIRCSEELKTDFKRFAAGFKTQREALKELLNRSEKLEVFRTSKIK